MPKMSAYNAVVLVGGYNIPTYFSSYDVSMDANPIEVTGFQDGWKNYIPGMPGGTLSLAGWWDSAAGKSVAALKGLDQKVVSIVPDGFTLGNPGISLNAIQANFHPSGKTAGAIELGAMSFTGYGVDAGPLMTWALCHQTVTTTGTTVTTGYVDPSGGDVTARCAGFLHIWQLCASETSTILIEHSTTLVGGYTTLVTFTMNGSAIGSQEILVASTTIHQYRRVSITKSAGVQTLGLSVTFWHA